MLYSNIYKSLSVFGRITFVVLFFALLMGITFSDFNIDIWMNIFFSLVLAYFGAFIADIIHKSFKR